MTAKEKAYSLVLSYKNLINFDFVSDLRWHDPSPANNAYHERVKKDAKQCAKIAVEELIKEQTMWQNGDVNPVLFWQDVLKEIDLL